MNPSSRLAVLFIAIGTMTVACRDERGARPEPAASAPAALPPKPDACAPQVLIARRGTPLLDGNLDQPVWHAAQATAPFVAERRERPVPHTEARASWDDGALFVVLYSADEELRSTDRVGIEFDAARSIEASPNGKLHCRFGAETDCAALGINAAFDVDGDVDATAREDEEWIVVVSVPWSRLTSDGRPPELPVSLRRFDTVTGKPVRTVWGRGCGVIRMQ